MCVICVSGKGVRQPNRQEITNMFTNNYHGAGYMFVRGGHIEIHKGYDNLADFLDDIEFERFTENDVVVYHFRIATQARRYPMTQPFPLSRKVKQLQAYDCNARFGVAHNGIISLTSNGDPALSDTALYIRDYLAPRIQNEEDIPDLLSTIESETPGSKIAILASSGRYYLTGKWIYENGLLFSNDTYEEYDYTKYFKSYKKGSVIINDYDF